MTQPRGLAQTLPRQRREPRIVKDMPAAEIAQPPGQAQMPWSTCRNPVAPPRQQRDTRVVKDMLAAEMALPPRLAHTPSSTCRKRRITWTGEK